MPDQPHFSSVSDAQETHGSEEVRSLSRKIKSCEACRKMKIKCVFASGENICERCQSRNLQCKLSKNIQGILADDLAWKTELESTLIRQQEQLTKQQDQISSLQKAIADLARTEDLGLESGEGPAKRRRVDQSKPCSGMETDLDRVGNLLQQPDSRPLLPLRATRQKDTDILSRKLISVEDALDLLTLYLSEMDPELFHIIRNCHILNPRRRPGVELEPEILRGWLDEIRNSSSLLLLSLLSVAALHQSGRPDLFMLVYKEFIRLAAMMAFSQQHDLDDLRALVIGAFYLSDVSWILVGTLVRVATEQGLHLSYKTDPSSSKAYEEARLYYFVYLVDHQASITPHGRPPMTRQHSGIRSCTDWLLRCCGANGVRIDDQRLISQVKLFEILHDTVDLMGTDATQPLDAESLLLEKRFSHSLQEWLKESSLQLLWSCNDEEKKRKYLSEARLHHSFAFLFLESFAFRAPPDTKPSDLVQAGGLQVKTMAARAEETANSILSPLSSKGQDLGDIWSSHIRYGPAYLYSMVISTVVFLVKVQENRVQDAQMLKQVLERVDQALSKASEIAQVNCDQHLLRRFVDRSGELVRNLAQLTQAHSGPSSSVASAQHSGFYSDNSVFSTTADHHASSSAVGVDDQGAMPEFTLEEFDLLSNTHSVSGLNLWSDIFENAELNNASADTSSLNAILHDNL